MTQCGNQAFVGPPALGEQGEIPCQGRSATEQRGLENIPKFHHSLPDDSSR